MSPIRTTSILALLLLGVAQQALAQLAISNAWVRAMPPSQSMTAAYLTIKNTGAPVTMTGATASVAGTVELHTTVERDGMLQMRQLDRLPITAGATVHFAPGGMHLMLKGVQRMPARGEVVRLCLRLAGGGDESVCTDAAVGDGPPAGALHHEMGAQGAEMDGHHH